VLACPKFDDPKIGEAVSVESLMSLSFKKPLMPITARIGS